MTLEITTFTWALALLWFLFYWIFGGVFFSVITLLKWKRLYKVRFSCLFTFVCALSSIGAAITGAYWTSRSSNTCIVDVPTGIDGFITSFACGFVGFFASFLIWASAVVLGGFMVMAVSRRASQQQKK